jgi:hypothetical protein
VLVGRGGPRGDDRELICRADVRRKVVRLLAEIDAGGRPS